MGMGGDMDGLSPQHWRGGVLPRPGCTGSAWAVLGHTGLYWVRFRSHCTVPGCTIQYQTGPHCTGSDWVLPYWAIPYHMVPGQATLHHTPLGHTIPYRTIPAAPLHPGTLPPHVSPVAISRLQSEHSPQCVLKFQGRGGGGWVPQGRSRGTGGGVLVWDSGTGQGGHCRPLSPSDPWDPGVWAGRAPPGKGGGGCQGNERCHPWGPSPRRRAQGTGCPGAEAGPWTSAPPPPWAVSGGTRGTPPPPQGRAPLGDG